MGRRDGLPWHLPAVGPGQTGPVKLTCPLHHRAPDHRRRHHHLPQRLLPPLSSPPPLLTATPGGSIGTHAHDFASLVPPAATADAALPPAVALLPPSSVQLRDHCWGPVYNRRSWFGPSLGSQFWSRFRSQF